MADFKSVPQDPPAGETLLASLGLDQVPGAIILAVYWPSILGVLLFIGFKMAGRRLWGSACIGVLAIVQLWVVGIFG